MHGTSENGYFSSYYAATAHDAPARPALEGEKRCDVCILGAGYSGLATALFLAEKGFDVIVLEAERVGWGASGRNGGHMINGFTRGYGAIKSLYGQEAADAVYHMFCDGAEILRGVIKNYDIDCDFKETGNIFAAARKAQVRDLDEERQVWEKFGHSETRILDAEEIAAMTGSDSYCGGMFDPKGGHLHPLNLALGEAAALEKLGGKIYENSRVTSVDYEKDKPEFHTTRGKIIADFGVICGGAYMENTVKQIENRVMPVASRMIATEVLDENLRRTILPQDATVEDCNYILDYYRFSADGRLIFGDGYVYAGEARADTTEAALNNMRRVFPQLEDVKVEYAWSGTMGITLRRLPHTGRLSPNVYFVQGYSGHGITTTHLMGKLIADAIAGQAEGFEVFASLKQLPFPFARRLRVPFTLLGRWYYALRDKTGL
ncbi:MAG: FAD-binding oxidoreductase [Micavibrio sp.]|nr:MAG: FAD-binding oxidoreductase [Micavibrio sp.]